MELSKEQIKERFLEISLDPKTVESTLKNNKVTKRLLEVIEVAGIKECNKTIGNLLYLQATKTPESLNHRTKLICDFIVQEKITRTMQLEEGINFLKDIQKTKGGEADVSESEFSEACGVGITITEEDITKVIDHQFEEFKTQIDS